MGMKESIGGEFLLGISSIDTHSVTHLRSGGCGCVFEAEEDLRSEVDWIGGVLGP